MRTMEWQGICLDQGWQIRASARLQPARRLDGLVAFGEQRTADYDVTWQLSTDTAWAAERLDVRVVGSASGGDRLNRTLLLERTSEGWRSRAWASDAAALPVPGLVVADYPSTTVDAVIDACPLSHWAPIRRLGLAGPRPVVRRGGPSRPLAAAQPVLRVRLPSLSVVLTRQRYSWVADAGTGRLLRHSFAGGSPAEITVDSLGVPLEFDGLTRRPDSAQVA